MEDNCPNCNQSLPKSVGCPTMVDAGCIYYHLNNQKLSLLTGIKLGNGTTLEAVVENLDAAIKNMQQIDFRNYDLPYLTTGGIVRTMEDFATRVDEALLNQAHAGFTGETTPTVIWDEANPAQASVRRSATAGQRLQVKSDGLYVAFETADVTKLIQLLQANPTLLTQLKAVLGTTTVPGGPTALAFTNLPLPSPVINVPYSQQIQVSGGTGPYSFARLSGNLPTGLTLSATGLLAGTPTGNGTFTSVIRVTDSAATAQSLNSSFAFTVTGSSCVAISSVTLSGDDSVSTGATESYVATPVGGSAATSYLWTVSGGTITSGAGTASVIVQWTTVGSKSISVTVNNCANLAKSATKAVTVTAPTCTGTGTINVISGANGTYTAGLTIAAGTPTKVAWKVFNAATQEVAEGTSPDNNPSLLTVVIPSGTPAGQMLLQINGVTCTFTASKTFNHTIPPVCSITYGGYEFV